MQTNDSESGTDKPAPQKRAPIAPDSALAAQAPEPGAPEAAAPEPGADAIAARDAEIAALKEQVLRALAEMENLRRRGAREREDSAKFAISAFAKDLLNVPENLRRAIDAVPPDQRGDGGLLDRLLSGVEAVERELLNAFEKHGLVRVDPMGDPFDHNLHQAMFEMANTGKPAGAVAQVLQTGYVLNGRLLRPAMVGVAKDVNEGEAPRIDTTA